MTPEARSVHDTPSLDNIHARQIIKSHAQAGRVRSASIDGYRRDKLVSIGPQAKMDMDKNCTNYRDYRDYRDIDNTAGEQELKLPARCEGGSGKPSVG